MEFTEAMKERLKPENLDKYKPWEITFQILCESAMLLAGLWVLFGGRIVEGCAMLLVSEAWYATRIMRGWTQ